MNETWIIELSHPTTPDEKAIADINSKVTASSDSNVEIESVDTDFVGFEPITATAIVIAIGTGVVGSGLVALIQELVAAGRLKRANRQVLQALVLDELAGQGLKKLKVQGAQDDEGFTRFTVLDETEKEHSICIANNGIILKSTE